MTYTAIQWKKTPSSTAHMTNSTRARANNSHSWSANFSKVFRSKTAVSLIVVNKKKYHRVQCWQSSWNIATYTLWRVHFVALNIKTSILQWGIFSNWVKSFAKPSWSTSVKKSNNYKSKLPCGKKSTSPQATIKTSLLTPTLKGITTTRLTKSMPQCSKPESTAKTPKGQSLKKRKKTCWKKKPSKSTSCSNTPGPTRLSNATSCCAKPTPKITFFLSAKITLPSPHPPSRKNPFMRPQLYKNPRNL